MRGAYNIVNETLSKLPKNSISNIIDIGLALGMQIPWTYEIANSFDADLYSLDLNLKQFFHRSIHKYLPPRGKSWDSYPKTSDQAEVGYDPLVSDPLIWEDLTLINEDPPVYSYGINKHYLVHAHSTKFLNWFPYDIDIALIDGDHRYITVWNDLMLFRKKNGRVAFFDDIDTLFARHEVSMDVYLNKPDFELKAESQAWKVKGPGGTSYNEIREGSGDQTKQVGLDEFEKTIGDDSKQGVLTAIEDFVREYPGEYTFSVHETDAGGKSTLTGTYKQCGVLIRS
ncbi:MAG: hypothetical protein HOI47_09645 [Candidatus Scalindua sp.]|jgi:hypothetical protein|nr:hypothetical protein [Candidatus Scalindua sp.]MBT6226906.1 hypothetical protein [Candidatus Scalindua sp.]